MIDSPLPEVRVRGGLLRGRLDDGVPAYLGIPYAAAPVGEHRMRPPRAAAPWDGVRDATGYGPTAPKIEYPATLRRYLIDPTIAGDDYLNLNVWTPDPGAGGLPVLVWIHGGSFTSGSGAVRAYRGSAFARDGVVCVTINYRLQAEGFLHTPDGVSNLGLLDQIAALEWVRDNIAAFGGDPDRVTVAGQSAGAMSVATLLAVPRAAGLFRAAIAQSGAVWHTLSAGTGTKVAAAVAAELGVPLSRDAIAMVPAERMIAAAEAVTRRIQSSSDRAEWGRLPLTSLPFAPVVDGDVVPRDPLAAIADGAGHDVALLTGTTEEEARLMLVTSGALPQVTDADVLAVASAHGITPRPAPGDSPGDLLARVLTDAFYRIPALRLAETRAATAPTWMYRFDLRSTAAGGLLGAAHAVELPFVFDTLDTDGATLLAGTNAPAKVAATMHAAWVSFVTDLDPGWAPYHPSTRTTMLFDLASRPVDHPYAGLLPHWGLG
jgi:para-nitrobenzyl esterase